MSEWLDDGLPIREGRSRRPRLEAILARTPAAPAAPAAQYTQPFDGIVLDARQVPSDDAWDDQDADAIAGIRRALQARGLTLSGVLHAPLQQATRYRDPRAYQAYVEEMVGLP